MTHFLDACAMSHARTRQGQSRMIWCRYQIEKSELP